MDPIDGSTSLQPLPPLFFETSPPSPTSTSSSPLFHLPRELRDQIYDALFTHIRYRCMHGSLQLDIFYGSQESYDCLGLYRPGSQIDKLPVWLLTCKRILSEALTQFYREAQCLDYSGNWRYKKPSSFELVTISRIKRLDLCGITRSIELEFCDGYKDNPIKDSAIIVPILKGDSNRLHGSDLPGLVKQLQGREHRIKDLRLRVALPEARDFAWVWQAKGWVVDLSFLEGLGRTFERVEFVIDPVACVYGSNRDYYKLNVRNLAIAYRLLQLELERVGKCLVGLGGIGENGAGYKLKDWMGETADRQVWHVEVRKTREGKVEGRIEMRFIGLQDWQDSVSGEEFVRSVGQTDVGNGFIEFRCRAIGEGSRGGVISVELPLREGIVSSNSA